MTKLTARRGGTCGRCLQPISVGQQIEGSQGVGWRHVDCQPAEQPAQGNADLDRVVTYLRQRKAAGRLDGFTESLLSQYEVKGRLSEKQIASVLSKLSDVNPHGITVLPGRDVVPAARYCLEREDGQLYFVRIWRPPAGKERTPNFAQAYLLFGPSEKQIKASVVLEAIIKAGPANAAIRYGKEICHCCVCNARLTNYLSRALGIGPVCGGRFFDPDIWKAVKNSARSKLRANGIDPEASVDYKDNYDADTMIERRLRDRNEALEARREALEEGAPMVDAALARFAAEEAKSADRERAEVEPDMTDWSGHEAQEREAAAEMQRRERAEDEAVAQAKMDRDMPPCLDGPDDCSGPVEHRMALSSTGKSFARCEHHWGLALERYEETNRKYGGDVPPPDFDPYYAGERWSEDDV